MNHTLSPLIQREDSLNRLGARPHQDLRSLSIVRESIHAFVKTEAEYLSVLKTLVKTRARLLAYADVGKAILDEQIIYDIFSNVLDLYDFTEKLILSLRASLRGSNSDLDVVMSFARHMGSCMESLPRIYGLYLANLVKGVKLVEKAIEVVPVFDEFNVIEKAVEGVSLMRMLAVPEERVSMYGNMISDLKKFVEQSENLDEEASVMISAFAFFFEKQMTMMHAFRKSVQARRRCATIQEKTFNGSITIVSPTRFFLDALRVKLVINEEQNRKILTRSIRKKRSSKPSSYSMYLFNDMLLFADKPFIGSKTVRPRYICSLWNLEVRDTNMYMDELKESKNIFFTIQPCGEPEFKIFTKTLVEKRKWVTMLKKWSAIESLRDTGCGSQQLERGLTARKELMEAAIRVKGPSGLERWVEVNTDLGIQFFYNLKTGATCLTVRQVHQRRFETFRRSSVSHILNVPCNIKARGCFHGACRRRALCITSSKSIWHCVDHHKFVNCLDELQKFDVDFKDEDEFSDFIVHPDFESKEIECDDEESQFPGPPELDTEYEYQSFAEAVSSQRDSSPIPPPPPSIFSEDSPMIDISDSESGDDDFEEYKAYRIYDESERRKSDLENAQMFAHQSLLSENVVSPNPKTRRKFNLKELQQSILQHENKNKNKVAVEDANSDEAGNSSARQRSLRPLKPSKLPSERPTRQFSIQEVQEEARRSSITRDGSLRIRRKN